MDHNGCKLDIPYPAAYTGGKDTAYADRLLENYAGPNGELTAITQYLYQHFIARPEYGDLAGALECVAVVEMRHMDMLGELIVRLGGDPLMRMYQRRRPVFWSGSNVSGTKNAIKFLTENIYAEKKAIAAYEQRIKETKDESIRKLLGRIILDEEHHIKIFEQYRNAFLRR